MSFCWIKKARKHCFGEDTHLRCLAMFCVLPSCSAVMLRAVDDCKQWILERHSWVFHKRFDVPCDFACSGVGNMNLDPASRCRFVLLQILCTCNYFLTERIQFVHVIGVSL